MKCSISSLCSVIPDKMLSFFYCLCLSLTVEVQRAKGPNPADDRDPIFERGSTTTYSSFRKGTYSKPWSSEGRTDMDNIYYHSTRFVHIYFLIMSWLFCCFPSETDMFFLAISMVGTDFSMICQLFPHRARSEIKVSVYMMCKSNKLLH